MLYDSDADAELGGDREDASGEPTDDESEKRRFSWGMSCIPG